MIKRNNRFEILNLEFRSNTPFFPILPTRDHIFVSHGIKTLLAKSCHGSWKVMGQNGSRELNSHPVETPGVFLVILEHNR